jgi:hypothetical protein
LASSSMRSMYQLRDCAVPPVDFGDDLLRRRRLISRFRPRLT